MPRSEIQQSRCEFPGCRCTCMQRHSTQEICVRCMHHRAWHANQAPPTSEGHGREPESRYNARASADDEQDSQLQSQQRLIDNLLRLLELDPSDRSICCVCMERQCDTVLKPCGHARFCKRCLENVSVRLCPICRSEIRTKVAFIPL